MGINLGREIRAAIQTYDATDQIFRNAENDERQRERDSRDAERYEIEKKRAGREEGQAQRDEDLQERFRRLEEDRRNGAGAFADLTNAEAQQPAQAQPRAALSVGGATATLSQPAPQKDPVSQFIDPGVDRKYADTGAMWDRYYNELGSLMRESFVNKGDYGRAALVDAEVAKLRESSYEPTRRAAVAAAVAGAEGGSIEPLLQRAYGTLNDGRTIKPGSVQRDAKSGKYSMVIVDPSGKEAKQSFDSMGLAGTLMLADPLKVLEWNTGRGDKERDLAMDERRTSATETTARAALTKANADANRSNAEMRGAEIKARQDVLMSAFPLVNKTLKPEEMVGMSEADRSNFAQQKQLEQKQFRNAEGLIAVNPNLDPRVAAQIARNPGGLKVSGQENGRPFTMVGTQKVFLK